MGAWWGRVGVESQEKKGSQYNCSQLEPVTFVVVDRWSQWEHAPFAIENFTITTDSGGEVPWDIDLSGVRAMHEQFYVQGILGQVRPHRSHGMRMVFLVLGLFL